MKGPPSENVPLSQIAQSCGNVAPEILAAYPYSQFIGSEQDPASKPEYVPGLHVLQLEAPSSLNLPSGQEWQDVRSPPSEYFPAAQIGQSDMFCASSFDAAYPGSHEDCMHLSNAPGVQSPCPQNSQAVIAPPAEKEPGAQTTQLSVLLAAGPGAAY